MINLISDILIIFIINLKINLNICTNVWAAMNAGTDISTKKWEEKTLINMTNNSEFI